MATSRLVEPVAPAGPDRLVVAPGTESVGGRVAGAEERQVDHAEQRGAVTDQPERDTAQRHAVQEVHGAVDRVQRPGQPGRPGDLALLLADQPDLRRLLGEEAADLPLDRDVQLRGHVPVAFRQHRAGPAGAQQIGAQGNRLDRNVQQPSEIRHRARPRSMAAISCGRSSSGRMTASTEPTSTARWMLCTRSNSAATSPSFSARTADRTSASSVRQRGPLGAVGLGQPGRQLGHPRVGRRPGVDLAGEHHRGRRRAADHRGERALHREHGHRSGSAPWRTPRTRRRGSARPRRTRSGPRSSRSPGRSRRRTRAAGCASSPASRRSRTGSPAPPAGGCRWPR